MEAQPDRGHPVETTEAEAEATEKRPLKRRPALSFLPIEAKKASSLTLPIHLGAATSILVYV